MAVIYLGLIQGAISNPNGQVRHFAMISKTPQPKYDAVEEGEFSGAFNNFGLATDFVKTFARIPLETAIFDRVVVPNAQSKIFSIVVDVSGFVFLILDDERFELLGKSTEIPPELLESRFDDVYVFN